MSTSLWRGCAVVLALGAVAPALTHGQLPLHPFAGCCQACYQPPHVCSCTMFRPVVETHLRPHPVTTWRDVHETAFRCQTRVETVPVVTYQTRLRHEMVPYTVTRRVPQCATVMVPEHRLRYVPERHSVTPCCPPAHHPPGGGHVGRSLPRVPGPLFADAPDADEYGDWTTVTSRRKSISASPAFLADDFYEGDSRHRRRPAHTVSHRRQQQNEKPFVRAPSAALVWQTPGVE